MITLSPAILDELDSSAVGDAGLAGIDNGHGVSLVPVGPGSEAKAPNGVGIGHDDEPSSFVRGMVGEAPVARHDTFGLSPREGEVLVLIAEGRTNREIGERLFISQKTVGVHVGNILAKLRVSGRVEAAAVAIRLGLAGTATAGSTRER
jgi:DNA-binding CsgD family transcriptional regulator